MGGGGGFKSFPHWILRDTVIKRVVRSLLECILFVVGLGMLVGHVARIGAHVYFWKNQAGDREVSRCHTQRWT